MNSRCINQGWAQTLTTVWQKIRASLRGGPIEQNIGSILIPLGAALSQVKDIVIERTLTACDGNKERAAKILGVSARTLYRRAAENKEVAKEPPSR